MRSVRRGVVAAALALPLAFGFAGVAAAGQGGGEADLNWAEFEASYAAAGPQGAIAGDVESEAASAHFEKDGKKKHGDSRQDRGGKHSHKGGDKGKKKHGDFSTGWASYEESGAAAGVQGAAAWDVESQAWYLDKN